MSAADDILAAVKAIVETAQSPKRVFIRRASEKNPIIAQDMSLPCFAVSGNDDRETRKAWAGKKFVKYPVTLVYLTRELPGQRDAGTGFPITGSDVEAVLGAVSRLFLFPRRNDGKPGLEGVPTWNACEVTPKGPYKLPFNDQTVNASPLLLTFETLEDG
jgi:hypothetical protein